MNLQQNFELEMYQEKTYYKLFEQNFYYNELRTKIRVRNVLGKDLFEQKIYQNELRTKFCVRNVLRKNLVQVI